MSTYCSYCGRLMYDSSQKFCSESCRKLFKKATDKKLLGSPELTLACRKLDKYNAEHGTRYSYGVATSKGII